MLSVTFICASYEFEFINPLFELWFPHIQIGVVAVLFYFMALTFLGAYTSDINGFSGSASLARMAIEREKIKCSDNSLMVASCHEVGHALTVGWKGWLLTPAYRTNGS